MAQDTPEDPALVRDLHSAALRLLRHVRTADTRTGVGPARLSVLSILVFVGPRSIGELARLEQVAQPTMSKLVAGLKDEGLVTTAPDPDDGRSRTVRANARGTRLLHRARRAREARLADLLAPLGERDRRTLARAARILGRLLR